ncbi:MAG: NUDIX hydrolase [Planctomycetes bacterium]|nr:NUDIX hydrolase [Planctomycetota bacterium]
MPELASERLYEGERFSVERVRYASRGRQLSRDVIRHPGAVTIVPMVDNDHVCLIQNHRIAVGQTLIELPAGTLERGKDPRVTAERELAEETGYRASRWDLLHEFFLSPGVLDERMRLFLATGLTEGPTNRESGEQIENRVVAWDEAIDMVRRREIRDAKTIIGLLWADQCRA